MALWPTPGALEGQNLGRIAALWTAVAILGACATAPPRSRDVAVWSVEAPPALVAWLAADVARATFRGADPMPEHPGAPILRDGNGFRVEYAGGASVRAAMDARVLPPSLEVDSDGTRFGPVEIVPVAPATRAGTGAVALTIDVRPGANGRCAVRAVVRGAPPAQSVLEHLGTAFAALDDALSGREASRNSPSDGGCCPRHQLLRAALHANASSRRARAGDLQGARIDLGRAADCAPRSVSLRARLAVLDEQLARVPDSELGWRVVVDSGRLGLVGRALAARADASRERRSGTSTAIEHAERARRALEDGDLEGASAWLHESVRGGDPATPRDALRAAVLRARDDHGGAFALTLERLEREPGDPALVRELITDAARANRAPVALRALASCWSHVDTAQRDLAWRALVAQLAPSNSPEVPSPLVRSGRSGLAGRDYEGAPGVTPPR